ncbi:solute carrier family 45 member 3-like [Anneissia japonica]|uniref:solute carrier family 45 member 3-like n=1 Tax=Anneissia japonica TaxID=1529436 RepID=UPI001425A56C|nr:solute carrier family 45 member 3-like [Anneissia japonica]
MAVEHTGRFGFCYLIFLNSLTCGLELCTSAAFSYLPPMLLESGFSESLMSLVMAIGPLIALFCVPLMGTMSDRCTSRLGRRKPFILFLCIATLLSLVLIPNGSKVGRGIAYIFPVSAHSAELFTLALSVILLDFSSQACYTPFESLLSDPCKSAVQYNRSFAMFSLMMSLGGCLGYLITSVNWMDNAFGRYMGDQELTVFSLLIIIFFASLVTSICLAIDPPLEAKDIYTDEDVTNDANKNPLLPIKDKPQNDINDQNSLPTKSDDTETFISSKNVNLLQNGFCTFFKLLLSPMVIVLIGIKRFCQVCTKTAIADTYNAMLSMPENFQTLWCADLFTSIGIVGFRLYFTDFMGEALYHGKPEGTQDMVDRNLYEEGIRMGSWGLLLNCMTSMIFSAFLARLIQMYGTKAIYVFGMGVFTLATTTILFLDKIAVVVMLASLTGFGNAVVTTLPYTVLTMYHEQPEVFYPDMDNHSKLLNRKGTDIALLDGAYFLAEVVASFLFGVVVELTGTTTSYIACSAIFGVIGLFFVSKVKFS